LQTAAIADSADPTKQISLNTTNATTATTLTLASQQTTSQIINFPNVSTNDTVVTLAATQTLTNKTLTSPNISSGLSSAFWGIGGLQFRTNTGTLTDTSSTGTVATVLAANSFGTPTLSANSATTYTNATNMYIAGAPTAGTNVTITNPYSLYVAGGNSYMAGNLTLANPTTSRISTPVAELLLEQTGDSFGTTRFRLQNRNGANGAVFEQAGSVNLIDFIFSTPAGSNQNIRFEQRPVSTYSSANSAGEFQFGVAGNPSFITGPGVAGVLGSRLFTIGAPVSSGGVNANAQLHIQGNISSAAWGANGIRTRLDASTYTDTSSSGTVPLITASGFTQPTFAASSATTYSESSTMYIAGAPTAGTNVTQTSSYALHVGSGNVKFGGNSIVCGSNTTITNGSGVLTLPTSTDTLVGRTTTDTLTNKTLTGTTNTIDANNLRNGSTWVTSLSGSAPVQHQLLSYNGTNAVWQSPLFAYIATQLNAYSTGTVAQSGIVVTGTGTTFTADMVGGLLFFTGNPNPVQVVGFLSATGLAVDISQTITSTSYILYYGALASNGNGFTATNLLEANTLSCGNLYYSVGTASQTATTVTGVGTTFTTAMVGGIIRWTSGQSAVIIGFTSTTILTTMRSQTVTSGTYVIIYGGTATDSSGAVGANMLRLVGTTNQIALGLDGTDTTLSFPSSVGGSILTFPNTTDTIVGRATTDTLTNKTLTGTTNTVRATQLGTAGSDVVVSGATAPVTGQFLTATSATTAAWTNFSSLAVGWHVTFQEQQASGTNGGGTTANTYVVRVLNTTIGTVTWASLATNTVTLNTAGTYLMYAITTTRANSASRSRIQNTTANTTAILGKSVASTIATVNLSHVIGPAVVTIAGSTNFQVQTRAATAVATTGLGAPAGSGESEVYTTFYIQRLQ
jgi:hypothetical protein